MNNSNQQQNQQSATNNQQIMNQQFIGQVPSNNQLNQSNFNSQSMQQVSNPQSINNLNQQSTTNNQQMMNQQMMNQYQNYNGNPTSNQNKNDSKMLFIIIGVVALIVVAVVVLFVILNENNSKGNTINDYENGGVIDNGDNNDNNNQEEVNNNDSEDDENSISFKGFNIPKQVGYEYEIYDTSGLLIGNNTFVTTVTVVSGSLETIKSAKDELVTEYTNLGMNPSNVQVSNYGGKEALTMEIAEEGIKAILYVIDAGNDYSFTGYAMNSSYTIDYDNIETAVSLLSNAKYTGVYKVSTDNINVLEFKNLFE